jgi:serine/threonine protein kinase
MNSGTQQIHKYFHWLGATSGNQARNEENWTCRVTRHMTLDAQPLTTACCAEFCPRGSMYQLLHAPSVHLSWRQIYFMCMGAAKGMMHLHSQSILHRDLKSGELLSSLGAEW